MHVSIDIERKGTGRRKRNRGAFGTVNARIEQVLRAGRKVDGLRVLRYRFIERRCLLQFCGKCQRGGDTRMGIPGNKEC